MRTKSLAAVVAIALVGAVAVSVTGQEDALPIVAARTDLPAVFLAVEPLHELPPPTILEAALRNDYVSFNALYTTAKGRGENVSQFATLHELWTWSVSDPIGAFYGADMYEKLSRAFPGYAAYIADYRIVDDHGNVFYPTSETRKFLLDRVIEGKTPRVQVAEGLPIAPRPKPVTRAREVHRGVQASSPASEPKATPAAPAPAPKAGQEAYTPPVTKPAPVVQQQPQPVPQPAQPARPTPARPLAGRGILLLIIGLIGVGLLAVILRTPREEPMTIVQQPPSNVEPMRKNAPQEPPTDTRATG